MKKTKEITPVQTQRPSTSDLSLFGQRTVVFENIMSLFSSFGQLLEVMMKQALFSSCFQLHLSHHFDARRFQVFYLYQHKNRN